MKRGNAALLDGSITLAVAAWVGGHAALGAFAARIAFRDLPRGLAAPTMTTIFRSFDNVIAGCLLFLVLATLARGWTRGFQARSDWWVAVLSVGLSAVGALELLWVHPAIEKMFEAQRTLEPAFDKLHRISERCAHLEVLLAAALFFALAFARPQND